MAGVNEYGTGNASQYHRVMTMSPEGTNIHVHVALFMHCDSH